MRFLGAGKRFKPLGDLIEAFCARGFGETGIHFGVFVGLTGDRGLQVRFGIAYGQPRCRITDFGNVFHVAEGMSCFAFGGIAEHAGYIGLAFDVRLTREIKITAVRLGLAREAFFLELCNVLLFFRSAIDCIFLKNKFVNGVFASILSACEIYTLFTKAIIIECVPLDGYA